MSLQCTLSVHCPPQFGSITADRRNFHLSPKITPIHPPYTPFAFLSSPHAYLGPTLLSPLSLSLFLFLSFLSASLCLFRFNLLHHYLYHCLHPPGVLLQSLAHHLPELYCLCFSTHKVSCACLCRFAPETISPFKNCNPRRSLHQSPLDALIILIDWKSHLVRLCLPQQRWPCRTASRSFPVSRPASRLGLDRPRNMPLKSPPPLC